MFVAVHVPSFVDPFVVPGGPELALLGILRVVVPLVLGYWIYTDEKRRGADDPFLWPVIVGGFAYLSILIGAVVVVIFIWRREQRTGGIGPGRDRDSAGVSTDSP